MADILSKRSLLISYSFWIEDDGWVFRVKIQVCELNVVDVFSRVTFWLHVLICVTPASIVQNGHHTKKRSAHSMADYGPRGFCMIYSPGTHDQLDIPYK